MEFIIYESFIKAKQRTNKITKKLLSENAFMEFVKEGLNIKIFTKNSLLNMIHKCNSRYVVVVQDTKDNKQYNLGCNNLKRLNLVLKKINTLSYNENKEILEK